MRRRNPSDHRKYIDMLRRMTPAERLARAFDLSEQFKQRYIRLMERGLLDPPPDMRRRVAGRSWLAAIFRRDRKALARTGAGGMWSNRPHAP